MAAFSRAVACSNSELMDGAEDERRAGPRTIGPNTYMQPRGGRAFWRLDAIPSPTGGSITGGANSSRPESNVSERPFRHRPHDSGSAASRHDRIVRSPGGVCRGHPCAQSRSSASTQARDDGRSPVPWRPLGTRKLGLAAWPMGVGARPLGAHPLVASGSARAGDGLRAGCRARVPTRLGSGEPAPVGALVMMLVGDAGAAARVPILPARRCR